MTDFTRTGRNRIKRLPTRGHYDRETIHRILDEALICHVGFVERNQPYVIPINFARVDDRIVLHGAKASRLLKHIEAGHPVCVEVTIVDGLVLARSVFHHSLNYRSVVVFGAGRLIEDEQEKLAALPMSPGRRGKRVSSIRTPSFMPHSRGSVFWHDGANESPRHGRRPRRGHHRLVPRARWP